MEVSKAKNIRKCDQNIPQHSILNTHHNILLFIFLESTIEFDASALLTTNLPNHMPIKIRLAVSLEHPVDPRISLPSVEVVTWTASSLNL